MIFTIEAAAESGFDNSRAESCAAPQGPYNGEEDHCAARSLLRVCAALSQRTHKVSVAACLRPSYFCLSEDLTIRRKEDDRGRQTRSRGSKFERVPRGTTKFRCVE